MKAYVTRVIVFDQLMGRGRGNVKEIDRDAPVLLLAVCSKPTLFLLTDKKAHDFGFVSSSTTAISTSAMKNKTHKVCNEKQNMQAGRGGN